MNFPYTRKTLIRISLSNTIFKYCQFDEFLVPLFLNDIPLLAGRMVIFRLENVRRSTETPSTVLASHLR